MASHSTEQWHDSIWKPESASILSCSSWRFSQSPYVPFELERFQFFPLTTGSRVCSKERFFQGVEGKGLQVIYHFFSPFLFFVLHNLSVLFFFWVSLVVLFCLTCFSFFFFFFLFFCVIYVVFHIKKNWKIRKIQKQCVFCVHWYLCTLDSYWNKVF